jgi:hypothetical protein
LILQSSADLRQTFLCADIPLACGETLSNLTFLYALCWSDRADTPLDCGLTPLLLWDALLAGFSVILLHAMVGLPGGGLMYLCFGFGGMLADVNLENGGLPWLVCSDWLVTARLSCNLQTGCLHSLCWLHLPSISRAWLVPVNMLFSLIFLSFSIAFVVCLSATTSPPLQAMLMPSAVLVSMRGEGGFEVTDRMIGWRICRGGFAKGLGCMPLGHDLVPYLNPLCTVFIHLWCASLASTGISKQAR